jgi:hypothetical protein
VCKNLKINPTLDRVQTFFYLTPPINFGQPKVQRLCSGEQASSLHRPHRHLECRRTSFTNCLFPYNLQKDFVPVL